MKCKLLVCIFLLAMITTISATSLPFLIWNPENTQSADILFQLLTDLGYEGEITDDIYDYQLTLNDYMPLFTFASYWTSPEVLEDIQYDIQYYLQDGGSIYWEGEGILMHDFYRENIFMADISTCITEPATYLSGAEGMFESITYLACDSMYAQGIGGEMIALRAPDDMLCPPKAVATELPYRTILTSFEIACLNDDGMQTRTDYIEAVMEWLTVAVDIPEDDYIIIPEEFFRMECYPNPFNSSTVISFEVMEPAQVEINVFNILGQPVEDLVEDWYEPGEYSVEWSGSDHPTGIYFARLESMIQNSTIRMVLLK